MKENNDMTPNPPRIPEPPKVGDPRKYSYEELLAEQKEGTICIEKEKLEELKEKIRQMANMPDETEFNQGYIKAIKHVSYLLKLLTN